MNPYEQRPGTLKRELQLGILTGELVSGKGRAGGSKKGSEGKAR
jgi:hypothetical protein